MTNIFNHLPGTNLGIIDKKLIEELKNKQYQGALPADYLVSTETNFSENFSDLSLLNSLGYFKPGSKTTSSESADPSNYVDNTDQNRESGKSGETGGASGDLGAYLDGGMEGAYDNFDENDFLGDNIYLDDHTMSREGQGLDEIPDEGLVSLDSEKLTALFNRIRAMANLYLLLAQSLDEKEESLDKLAEALSENDEPAPQKKTTWAENAVKANQFTMQNFQKGLAALSDRIDKHNQEAYEKTTRRLEKWRDSIGDKIGNFLSSGSHEKWEIEGKMLLSRNMKKVADQNKKVLEHFQGLASGVNSTLTKKANDVLVDLIRDEDNVAYTGRGYIDMNKSQDWQKELRKIFIGIVNANRVTAAAETTKEETQKSLDEVLSEKGSGSSSKMKGASEAVESESAHMTQLFDRIGRDTLIKHKMFNYEKHYEYQLEKFNNSLGTRIASGICSLLSAILGMLSFIFPPLAVAAAGFALLAAGLSLAGAHISDAVADEYIPEVKNEYKDQGKDTEGSNLASRIEDIGRGIKGKVGFDQLDYSEDGYLQQVNHAEISSLQRQLNSVNAALTILQKNITQRGKILNALHRATSSRKGASADDEMIEASAEAVLAQSNVGFGALAFQLGEFSQGFNIEVQQAKQLSEATRGFWISAVTAVLAAVGGGLLGGLTSIAIGFTIGMGVGRAIAELVNALSDDAYGMDEYNPDTSEFKVKAGATTLESKIDALLNEINSELLEKGIADIGDGKFGVKVDVVAGLQKRFMRLMNLVSVLLSVEETKTELSAAISESYGFSSVKSDSSLRKLNQMFGSSFETFSRLKKLLAEQIQVKNRIAAADERVGNAATKFGVTAAMAALTFGLAASFSSFAGVILSLGSVAISIFNLTHDLIRSALKAADDYGDLEAYALQKAKEAKDNAIRGQDETSTDAKIARKLDAMEAQIFLDGSLLEDRSYGTIGINSGKLAEAIRNSTGVNRSLQIISGVIKQIQASLNMIQRATSSAPAAGNNAAFAGLDISTYQAKVVTEAVLQTQMEALQTVVSRHNQMSEATRNAILSSVQIAIQIALTALTIKRDIKLAEKEALLKQIKAQDMKPTPEQSQKLQSLEASIKMGTPKFICLSVLAIISSISTWAAGTIVDRAVGSSAKGKRAEEISKSKQSLTESGKEAKTYGQKLSAMEAGTLNSEIGAGEASLGVQDINFGSTRPDEGMDALKGLLQTSFAEGYKALKFISGKDSQTSLSRINDIIAGRERMRTLRRQLDETFKKYFNQSAQALAKADQAVQQFKAEQQQNPNNSQAHLARAEMIAASEPVINQVSKFVAAEKDVQEFRKLREAEVKHKTEPLGVKENKSASRLERPDQSVKSSEEIKQKIGEIAELQRKLKQPAINPVETQKIMRQIHARIQELEQHVSTSKIWSDASEATHVSAKQADKIQSELNVQLEKIVKDKFKQVDIKKLSAEQLEDLYHTLYRQVFKKASEQLQKARAMRLEIQKQLKSETDPEKISKLEAQLGLIQSVEGQQKQKIQGFNRLVGQINRLYKEKTGKDLKPYSEVKVPVPAADPKAKPASNPSQSKKTEALKAPAEAVKAPAKEPEPEKPLTITETKNKFEALEKKLDQGIIEVVRAFTALKHSFALAPKNKADQEAFTRLNTAIATADREATDALSAFGQKRDEIQSLISGFKKYEKDQPEAAKQMKVLAEGKLTDFAALEQKVEEIKARQTALRKELLDLTSKKEVKPEGSRLPSAPQPVKTAKKQQAEATRPVVKAVAPKQGQKPSPTIPQSGMVPPLPEGEGRPKDRVRVSDLRSQAGEAQRIQEKLASLSSGRSISSV